MDKKSNGSLQWVAIFVVVALLCVGAVLVARSIAGNRSAQLRQATLTPAYANQQVEVLGNGILYYDGATMHALDDKAKQIWSYAPGVGTGFSVGSGGVAAWTGTMLSLLTSDEGVPTFSSNVEKVVLDAYVGAVYTAVQVGEEHNSTMLILESGGRQVQRIELKNQTVLDFGFFYDDTMFWVMTLDTEGTVPLCAITTYRPGKMLTGMISDAQQVLYEVVFQSAKVRAVGTTHIKDFDYQAKEIADNRMLVYGWYLMGIDERAQNPLMAFVPIGQQDGSTGINDVRMIQGQVDQQVRMPYPAIRVMALGDAVYGFTNQYVSVCHLGQLTPTTYAMPLYIDSVIGITANRTAVVTSGGSVYLAPMP